MLSSQVGYSYTYMFVCITANGENGFLISIWLYLPSSLLDFIATVNPYFQLLLGGPHLVFRIPIMIFFGHLFVKLYVLNSFCYAILYLHSSLNLLVPNSLETEYPLDRFSSSPYLKQILCTGISEQFHRFQNHRLVPRLSCIFIFVFRSNFVWP